MLAPVPASIIISVSQPGSPAVLFSCCVPALVSNLGSPAVLISRYIPALFYCLGSSAVLSFYYMLVLCAFVALSLPCHASVSSC